MAEYNAKYNADYNADHNAKYNTEYNAEFVATLYYRKYYPEGDPDSGSAIPSYTTTMTIDDYKSTSESSPSNQYSLRSRMRLLAGGATTFKRGG